MHKIFAIYFLAFFAVAAHASAAPLLFTVDPTQSYLNLSITTDGGDQLTFPQTPGSDTSAMSGTIEIDLTPTSIQLLGGANLQFAMQAVPQQPLANGQPGSAPAQIGLLASIPGLAEGYIAARNMVGDATSAAIPIVGGTFDASQISMGVVTGSAAYNVNIQGTTYLGESSLTGPDWNTLTGGTVTTVGDIVTVTLPYSLPGLFDVGGASVALTFAGQVVATATVPEPATCGLLAVGLPSAVVLLRRRQG